MERTKPGRKQAVKIQTMSSNLPLLFANSRPTTLESMTEAQLEKFVCFMTKCSFIQKDSAWRKNEIIGDKPKWWPLHVPFKIPLESGYPSNFVDRKAMLKTLVCCCYTFYNCEFLLKFSSELAEMEPGSLCYVPSATGNITLIYTIQGTLLVKCRNENLTYDEDIQNGNDIQNKEFTKSMCIIDNDEVKCIDITDSLSDNDDEVHFKQGNIGIKRKLNGHYKTLNHKRPWCGPRKEQAEEDIEIIDLTDEPLVVAPIQEQTQADFLNTLGLVSTEDVSKHHKSFELNKKLLKAARRSYVLPFSTKCGQGVYASNKLAGNMYHIDRVNRYCSTTDLSRMQPVPQAATSSDDEELETKYKWTHLYKPGRRCQNPQRLHRGPSLKPCIVKLTRLSDEDIENIKTKIKLIDKHGREQFPMKTVCPQLKMTEGCGSELTQYCVKAKNVPVLNKNQSVIQRSKIMNTFDHENLESISPVDKHVGLSNSETGIVTVRGNGDALHLIEEHPVTRNESNKKLTLELKCSFPSNYLRNTVKIKINKLLTNVNYEPVNNNIKYLPRKLSLSKCLDSAIDWYTQRKSSGLKRTDCVNSQQLQENLVPVEFRRSMCTILGRANGKYIQCYCCAQGLYKFCVYDYIYKAKKAAVLEQKNYEQLKAHFIRMYFNCFQRSIE